MCSRDAVRSAAASALLLALLACADGPVDPPDQAACDGATTEVRSPARYEGLVVGTDEVGCVVLAGGGRSYLVLPQLTGVALPYGGYGFRLGDPGAALAAPALVLSTALHRAGDPRDPQHTLDGMLRRAERTLRSRDRAPVRRRDPAAAAVGGAATSVLDPDTARTFSVLSTLDAIPAFAPVGAVRRYTGEKVLIYVDTVAASAFTDAELDAMGALYDTDLAPAIHGAFGTGTDIDGNGRVILLLTPVVNQLVSASTCTTSGYVRGFFHPHDLGSDAPTSNGGEIFYAYVPDAAGTWSCAHTKAEVGANLAPTFVHELQHLVSYGEHVVIRDGAPEEPWLNEGLSHMAEELGARLFEARYPAPLGRTDPAQIFPDSAGPFITPNLLYAYRYLLSSGFYSVTSCAPGSFCSLAERGGAWLFLRWIVDRFGDAVLRQLVATPATGRTNLEAVIGSATEQLLGDFAIAVNGDSLPGVPRSAFDERHRFQSRNLRQLFNALFEAYGLPGGVSRPFPIASLPLGAGTAVTGTMRPGTFMPYRLEIGPSSAVARLRLSNVDGSAFPAASGAQLAILRIQ